MVKSPIRIRKRARKIVKRVEAAQELARLKVARFARQRIMDLSLVLPFAAPNSRMLNRDHIGVTIRTALELPDLLVRASDAMGYPAAEYLTSAQFAARHNGTESSALHLAGLFRQFGSDKSTAHDYHVLYSSILDPMTAKAMLEIGLGTNNVRLPSNMGRGGRPGASLRAFRDYLPAARIYGADVDANILFDDDRIESFAVDATDSESLKRLFEEVGQDLDLVIDDSLHSPIANLRVLSTALSRLRKEGWLVIEDIGPEKRVIWELIGRLIPRSEFQPWLIQTRQCLVFAVQRI